jgi:hypothetical protein
MLQQVVETYQHQGFSLIVHTICNDCSNDRGSEAPELIEGCQSEGSTLTHIQRSRMAFRRRIFSSWISLWQRSLNKVGI